MISRNACFWINCLVSSNDSFRQIIELLKFLNLKQGHMGGRTIPFLNHHHLGVTNRRFGLVIKAHTECIVKPLLPDNKAFSRPLARMALGCDTQQLRWKQNDVFSRVYWLLNGIGFILRPWEDLAQVRWFGNNIISFIFFLYQADSLMAPPDLFHLLCWGFGSSDGQILLKRGIEDHHILHGDPWGA